MLLVLVTVRIIDSPHFRADPLLLHLSKLFQIGMRFLPSAAMLRTADDCCRRVPVHIAVVLESCSRLS